MLHGCQFGCFPANLRNGHFGLVAVLISDESERDGFSVGSLPRNGALRRGSEDTRLHFFLGARFTAFDAVGRFVTESNGGKTSQFITKLFKFLIEEASSFACYWEMFESWTRTQPKVVIFSIFLTTDLISLKIWIWYQSIAEMMTNRLKCVSSLQNLNQPRYRIYKNDPHPSDQLIHTISISSRFDCNWSERTYLKA